MRLKQTSEKSETQKNLNFLFGYRGPLVMIFDWMGVETGGLDLDGGMRGMAGSQMGVGVVGQEGQMAWEGGDGRRTKWQLLGCDGQEDGRV